MNPSPDDFRGSGSPRGGGTAAGRDPSHDATPTGRYQGPLEQVVNQLLRLLDEVTLHGEIPVDPGWIPCAFCTGYIPLGEYHTARCWKDPNGVTAAAHVKCLVDLGERDLGLG